MKFLIVVDMQVDFVNGTLGTPEAEAIVPSVARKIEQFDRDGKIFVTLDTHDENYMLSLEGKYLPVMHCLKYSPGWALNSRVSEALYKRGYFRTIEKKTFGSQMLVEMLSDKIDQYGRSSDGKIAEITIIGLCTDICVVSNALLLRAGFPNAEIIVDAKCCAGVTPEKHQAALEVMRSCQIHVEY